MDYFAATEGPGNHGGSLGDAFLAIPLVGRRGQWALTAGQFTPLMYQYDPVNSLANAPPAALKTGLDSFAFLAPMPGLRADCFDHRERTTADGNCLSLGVPFEGQLPFDSRSQWDGPHGAYAHAFRRQGYTTYGLFGYSHDRNHLEGLVATNQLLPNLYLLGIGETGRDGGGEIRCLSLEANYVVSLQVALTGRWEATAGQ